MALARETNHSLPRLIIVIGPTAAGKTSLAIQLAKEWSGAVVSADSRQIYSGLDIGTAKPAAAHAQEAHSPATLETIDDIPHYMLNIRRPTEPYDLAAWQADAYQVIDALTPPTPSASSTDSATPPQAGGENFLPFLVGGTMLYVDSIAYNFSIPAVSPNPEFRAELMQTDTHTLYQRLLARDPKAANFVEPNNTRRIIRALEVIAATGQPFSAQRQQQALRYATTWIGIFPGWDRLRENITTRVHAMMDEGLVDELQGFQQKYGPDLPLLKTLNYIQAAEVLAGTLSPAQAIDAMIRANLRYAHRQMSWWKRNDEITWFEPEQSHEINLFLQASI